MRSTEVVVNLTRLNTGCSILIDRGASTYMSLSLPVSLQYMVLDVSVLVM